MSMLTGELLDSGGRGLAQAVAAATSVVLLLLAIAVLLPVAIVASLLSFGHTSPDTPSQTSPAPANPAQVLPAPPSAASAPGATRAPPDDRLPVALGNGPVDVARRYLGIPYVFGGTNPAIGLDCSGLVQLVFRQLGVALPRTAQQQYDATARVGRDALQPGDLVFFARTYADPHDWVTHVGIYIGNGLQINAPTEGQVVSIQPVFTGFWGDHFIGGGRPLHG